MRMPCWFSIPGSGASRRPLLVQMPYSSPTSTQITSMSRRLSGLGAPVYGPADANMPGLEIIPVKAEQEFIAAGFRVRAVGGRHASIYRGLPDCADLGYVGKREPLSPGRLARCSRATRRNPAGPRARVLDDDQRSDRVRQCHQSKACLRDPRRQLNERGLASVNGWLEQGAEGSYRYPGESVHQDPSA